MQLLDLNSEGLYELSGLTDIQNFYFYTYKILLSGHLYKFTKKLQDSWKENLARQISDKIYLTKLLENNECPECKKKGALRKT